LTSQVLEIVELENGDVVLRSAEAPKEVLLTIKFSDKLEEYVDGIKLAIAKSMIQAGSDTYADIAHSEIVADSSEQPIQPIIH